MKKVISVSLGSSARNAAAQLTLGGETFEISRQGHDGDLAAMRARLIELDGKVDAIGLGGGSCYLYGKQGRKYPLRAICKLASVVRTTPVVDGSLIKDTLERDIVEQLPELGVPLQGRRVLMVCGLERIGMAEALVAAGAEVHFGDAMFALGLPFVIRKLSTLHRLIGVLAPLVSRMPFSLLYPSGQSQNKQDTRYGRHYAWADVIAGDHLYIRAHLPLDLTGKVIVTNTITPADAAQLRERNALALVTATPEIEGRCYGTNVMEALMTAMAGRSDLTADDHRRLFQASGLTSHITWFQEKSDAC